MNIEGHQLCNKKNTIIPTFLSLLKDIEGQLPVQTIYLPPIPNQILRNSRIPQAKRNMDTSLKHIHEKYQILVLTF